MPSVTRLAGVLLSCLLLATVYALPKSKAQPVPKFSSAYTDLNTQCKNAFESVGEGQDMPLKCKGYGGYHIDVGYSAWAAHINVTPSGGGDSIPLATQPLGYTDAKGRKIEWRMADGVPFAVILRVTNYRESDDGGIPFEAKYVTGESLRVKGLKDYEQIDHDLDVKKVSNSNVKAREMADQGYLKIKGE